MERAFHWEDHGPDYTALYGPEPYMIAAVITRGRFSLEQGFCWWVASNEYRNLNFTEEDTSLSLKQLKNRTLIRLGQELKERKEELDADLSCVRSMLFANLPEEPYE